MTLATPLSSPLLTGWSSPVSWLETRPESVGDQYLLSVVAIVGFLLAVGMSTALGRVLRDRFSHDAIQAIEWFTITAMSVVLGGVLVGVWGITAEVEMALAPLTVTAQAAVRALVTFIAAAGAYSITRLSKRSIKYGAGRDYISDHQREIAHHIVQVLLFLPVIGFVVTLWGIPIRNLFIGAGALGIIVGFAARQTLSGALSGFVILFARPFEVGDWVALKDHEGIVTDITLYNTRIRTFNEEHVLVPNDAITGDEIINYTETDRLRLTTDVNVDYETDLDHAVQISQECLEDIEHVSETPAPSVVRAGFADSSVVLQLRYWIDHPSINRKWLAQDAVITGIKRRFEQDGVEIPFPQRTITHRENESASEGRQVQSTSDRSSERNSLEGAPRGPSGSGGGS